MFFNKIRSQKRQFKILNIKLKKYKIKPKDLINKYHTIQK